MVKFKVTQNRKPWSHASAWVLLQAEFLASDAENLRIETVKSFADRLRDTLEFKSKRDGAIHRGIKGIVIKTWETTGGQVVCGVDKPNSVSSAAFIITTQ